MRGVSEIWRRASVLAFCLLAILPSAPLHASSIDPDPASPTLGDLLDAREKKRQPTSPPARAHKPPRLPARHAETPELRLASQPLPEAQITRPLRPISVLDDNFPAVLRMPSDKVDPPRTIRSEPRLPPRAATVFARGAVARNPRLPSEPPTPPLVPPDAGPPLEPAPKAAAVPQPPARPATVRRIPVSRVTVAADSKLLRDPTITNATPAAGGDPVVEVETPMPPRRRPVVQTAAAQPVILPPLQEPPRVVPRMPGRPAPNAANALGVGPGGSAPAATPSASPPAEPIGDRFVYVIDQDLKQFLTDFSRRVGLRADVAANVRGRLTRTKLPLEPTALLRDLEKRFDLEWLIEGEILKVASRSDLATRILPLGAVGYDDLLREMRAIDIDVSRYPLKRLSESNAVIITAPSAFIGRLSALIDTLKAGKSIGPDLRIVRFGASKKVEWD